MSETAASQGSFGRVPMRPSPVGLGTYHLTSDRRVEHGEAVRMVTAARRLGVRVIDTAPMYGIGEAEQIVGEAIAGTDTSDLILLDKIGRFEKSIVARLGDDAYRDVRAMRAQFEHSLRVLRISRLPVLLLHETDWTEWWDDITTPSGVVLELIAQLKAEGLIGAVGLSVRKADVAASLCQSGLFDAMLFVHYYNMVWQEAGDVALPAAAAVGMGIAVGAPYRQGLLTSADPDICARLRAEQRGSTPPGIVDRIERAQAIARRADLPMVEMGLRWLLTDPRVHTVIVGPRSQQELEENLMWAERGPLEDALMKELRGLRDIEPGRWPG
jgi:D-threo-aldose 1-dehydrogenase